MYYFTIDLFFLLLCVYTRVLDYQQLRVIFGDPLFPWLVVLVFTHEVLFHNFMLICVYLLFCVLSKCFLSASDVHLVCLSIFLSGLRYRSLVVHFLV